jgi:hypothetical protein
LGASPAWLAEESDSSRSFLGIAIVAGFLQIWTARFLPSQDGTNYLETATANLNGDWKNEVNALWSPFFSLAAIHGHQVRYELARHC